MIALSWSRWADYAQCPRKFYLKYIEKSFPPFDSKAMHLVRGSQLHLQLERYADYLNDPTQPEPAMSEETACLKPKLQLLKQTSISLQAETQMSVQADWSQVDWFSKATSWRCIMDAIATRVDHAIIWDYKSGKFNAYADDCGQLHLSAAMVLLNKQELDYVEVSYLFLDSKKPSGVTVARSDIPKIRDTFEIRFQRVQTERDWNPTKNNNCGWCEATKAQCPNSKKF